MFRSLILSVFVMLSISMTSISVFAVEVGLDASSQLMLEKQRIARAALDYIESQHSSNSLQMQRSLDEKLAKRTYWQDKEDNEFVMETDRNIMLEIAKSYNANGDKFPKIPKKQVTVLDVEGRVASVKLEADDWIDYMHLYKNADGDWKIINVLWQFKDQSKHSDKKQTN
ncbi:nuclear transport factor 2 family protein [Marinibactrum halimedae]|uniref:Nuclear transport factor 2 family protein n=1 Tax=Marinibactrum halimedae TaxID=1444977 RepID=A0AA37TAH9_9GAMM|nr:nuclear transport factor 2 family protein [Marinibactrum halimedae]MCD9460535.1 nuclear transport factor 2 family protein [Marinibactrum halimedae]GLS27898.1 hypothetical protein GCM10007877_36170 [Marinibactrum halimedae]